jgi:hypothetical protein
VDKEAAEAKRAKDESDAAAKAARVDMIIGVDGDAAAVTFAAKATPALKVRPLLFFLLCL